MIIGSDPAREMERKRSWANLQRSWTVCCAAGNSSHSRMTTLGGPLRNWRAIWDARGAASEMLEISSRRRRVGGDDDRLERSNTISSRIGDGLATARTYEIRQQRKCVSL